MDEVKPSGNKKGERKEEEVRETPREPVRVKDLLLLTLANLEGKAWAYLGAVTHIETGEMKKDLKEAKLAIDTYSALLELLKEEVGEDERKHLELVLANLRLNFVREKE